MRGEILERSTSRNFKKLIATMSCLLAFALAATGAVITLIFGGPSVVFEAIGILLGGIGYGLGMRRLGIAAVIVCVLVMFLGLAAGQGILPGTQTLPVGDGSSGSI